jgi:C-terminal processing protease CtpA/Prc
MDSVYSIQNKKIGYLVYNFFTNDDGDGSMRYDVALNNTFRKFKQQQVTELILDLRYNRGGMMSSAVNLASMIVPGLSSTNVFTYTDYNDNFKAYFNSEEFKKENTENPFVNNFATSINISGSSTNNLPVENIGQSIKRIFFLTGEYTASASEMVINGLKPYLPCTLIGDTTIGKNVGSILINDDENLQNQWAIMPIVLKYFNKDRQSDFTKGFVPNILVQDDCLYPLGDTREALLATAFSQILGAQKMPSMQARFSQKAIKSSVDFKKLHSILFVNNKFLESYINKNLK